MNISLSGRHLELTEAIKAHLNTSIETFSKFHIDIISVSAIVSLESKKGKDHTVVEFVIHLAHKNSVIITQKDTDLYAAIDLAAERARKALRRMHDREIGHHKDGLNEAKAEAQAQLDVHEVAEAGEDEIVPVRLELYKPREVEDVLNELKESEKLFEIFIDNDGKTRVLYKRSDARFGLY